LQVLLDTVGDVEHIDIGVLGVSGDTEVDVVTVTHDSRRVPTGSLYACIPGARFDGHDHAAEAVAAGAVALLVERELPIAVPQVRVREVRTALGPIAAAREGWPSRSLECVGITGTNGKTTTTYLLESIGAATGRTVGVIGTTGARVAGVPVPLEHTTPEAPELQALLARMRDDGVGMVAMEVSSHALAQHRVDGTHFAAVAFTNLSHDHLDYHGSFDEYFAAKARLFTPGFTGRAAIGIDDPWGPELAERARSNGLAVLTYGIDGDADLAATQIESSEPGSAFVMTDRTSGDAISVTMSLIGRVNVLNALTAAATARLVGLDLETIGRGLGAAVVVPGRLERVDAGQPFTVIVDYAHTPDALGHALAASREHAGGHKVIAVVGCGGDRDRAKRPTMGALVATRTDTAIITSDNPRSESAAAIADEMLAGVPTGMAVRVELDRRLAIREAVEAATPGDVVLIAGKGHESGQTTGTTTVPFDDRVVAREEIEAAS